jgi:hypothetical protein
MDDGFDSSLSMFMRIISGHNLFMVKNSENARSGAEKFVLFSWKGALSLIR